jgi:lipoyl(octanoyl) transferase
MISVLNLGLCDYATALRLQETLVDLRKQERVGNVLLFVEHPPVITLGRNANDSNIIASRELLALRGVEVHEINRGGDVTFHGPGQLVAYPIFDLRSFAPKIGVIEYVRRLEEVLMRICIQYAIETQRIPGMTGVWTFPTAPPRLNGRKMGRDYLPAGEVSESAAEKCSERKIAAIGVHISRGVTSHGFALNVTTDLDFFNLIVPCGLTKPVTSIEFETGLRPTLGEVMTLASRTFGELFHSQMLWLESIHDLIPTESAPADTPARAPENLRSIAGDDTHLA